MLLVLIRKRENTWRKLGKQISKKQLGGADTLVSEEEKVGPAGYADQDGRLRKQQRGRQ